MILDDSRGTNEFSERVSQEIYDLIGQRYNINVTKRNVQELNALNSDVMLSEIQNSDVVMSLGFNSSAFIRSFGRYPVPCIAGISLERSENDSTGINNYTYVQSPFSLERDFEVFQSIIDFQKLGIFVDPLNEKTINSYISSISKDFEIQFVPISGNPITDLSQLESDVDAIYILPDLYDSPEKDKELFDAINDKQLPSFSLIGRQDVTQGVLASVSPTNYLNVYARRLALNTMKILEGVNPSSLSTQIGGIEEDFVINMATMKKIEVYPPLDVISEASFVDIDYTSGVQYNLKSAVAQGLRENISLRAANKNIGIQDEEVDIAQSNLLPNLEASTSFVGLDGGTADLLKSTSQPTPQNEWSGTLALTQVIYSEPAWANVSIQNSLLKAEKEGFISQQLDIVLDICTAYINYLQVKANLNIQNNNVQTTLSNLNIAKNQAKIGTISMSDVHGLETQLAINKSALNDAITGLDQAKIRFNQLLNRPLEEEFVLEDISIEDELIFIANPQIGETIQNRYDIINFANFLVDYAFENTPDIKQLEWSIKAQERALLSSKRSLYQPQLALQGNLDRTFGRYGTRVEDSALEAFGLDPYQPTWNVGLNASLPIFQGNLRRNRIQRDKLSLEQLNDNRDLLKQSFDSNIRLALENLGNDYNDITFNDQAKESSAEFLKIVQELYREGATTIITLLEAQNNSLSAQLGAVNIRYQFILDAIIIERLINQVYLLSTNQEKEEFVRSYFDYITQNKK